MKYVGYSIHRCHAASHGSVHITPDHTHLSLEALFNIAFFFFIKIMKNVLMIIFINYK